MILAHRSLLPVPSTIDKSSVRINFLEIDKEYWRHKLYEGILVSFLGNNGLVSRWDTHLFMSLFLFVSPAISDFIKLLKLNKSGKTGV